MFLLLALRPAAAGAPACGDAGGSEPAEPQSSALTGPCAGNTAFGIGTGVYDITGPAAEVGMMGYAMIDQKTAGIHQRLRARAFVISSPCNGKRLAFVSADLGLITQGVKQQVVERLRAAYGSAYGDDNVMLSANHTHSGPGGCSHYALYDLTILGYDAQGFEAIVNGIYQAVRFPHPASEPLETRNGKD